MGWIDAAISVGSPSSRTADEEGESLLREQLRIHSVSGRERGEVQPLRRPRSSTIELIRFQNPLPYLLIQVTEGAEAGPPQAEHPISQSGNSGGGQDGRLADPLLESSPEEPNLHEGNPNSHNNGTTGQEGDGHGPARNDTQSQMGTLATSGTTHYDSEEVKHAQKIAYCTIAIAGGGIVAIIGGLAVGQIGQAQSLNLKICIVFLMVTFTSAMCLILLSAPRCSTLNRISIIRALEYTTMGTLTLAILEVSFAFLKLLALILVVVPILLFLLLAFHFRSRHNPALSAPRIPL